MELSTAWALPPPNLGLSKDEIHLWRAPLNCEPAVLRRLEAILAPDEKSRAEKFVFAVDRDRFIAARGILRELLGAYLCDHPALINIAYGPHGKPFVARPASDVPIHFNLSHSHGLAVYAFSLRREVGVDIETIRPDFASRDIAERFFSSEEVMELESIPPERRAGGFFLCWTRKEAYIKARGEGLQIPLDSFRVTLTPGQPAQLTSADSRRWNLHSFQPAEGYAGAAVGEVQDRKLRYWQWGP